jgi:hypothetical protein
LAIGRDFTGGLRLAEGSGFQLLPFRKFHLVAMLRAIGTPVTADGGITTRLGTNTRVTPLLAGHCEAALAAVAIHLSQHVPRKMDCRAVLAHGSQ